MLKALDRFGPLRSLAILLGTWLVLSVASVCFAAPLPVPGELGAPADPRYCGEPARYPSGGIKRSSATLRHFVAVHPCPVTGLHETSCPNWQIDHVIPLASGGCDEIGNLQWLPNIIKTCAVFCKDRFERVINDVPPRTFEIQGDR